MKKKSELRAIYSQFWEINLQLRKTCQNWEILFCNSDFRICNCEFEIAREKKELWDMHLQLWGKKSDVNSLNCEKKVAIAFFFLWWWKRASIVMRWKKRKIYFLFWGGGGLSGKKEGIVSVNFYMPVFCK